MTAALTSLHVPRATVSWHAHLSFISYCRGYVWTCEKTKLLIVKSPTANQRPTRGNGEIIDCYGHYKASTVLEYPTESRSLKLSYWIGSGLRKPRQFRHCINCRSMKKIIILNIQCIIEVKHNLSRRPLCRRQSSCCNHECGGLLSSSFKSTNFTYPRITPMIHSYEIWCSPLDELNWCSRSSAQQDDAQPRSWH